MRDVFCGARKEIPYSKKRTQGLSESLTPSTPSSFRQNSPAKKGKSSQDNRTSQKDVLNAANRHESKENLRNGDNRRQQYRVLEENIESAQHTDDKTPLLCGVKPVIELLESDPSRIDVIYIRRSAHGEAANIPDRCRRAGIRFVLTDSRDLDRMLEKAGCRDDSHPENIIRHQGVIARLAAASYMELSLLLETAANAPLPLLIMADQIQDPGNLGTLARTLYALGGAGIIVPRHNSAFLGTGARRAAAGTLEKLPVSRVTNLSRALEQAHAAGFHIYGAAVDEESVSLYDTSLQFPAILVLGNEEKGIRQQVSRRCETKVHIPMLRNFDSLNVAQAGAICIAECARQFMLSR